MMPSCRPKTHQKGQSHTPFPAWNCPNKLDPKVWLSHQLGTVLCRSTLDKQIGAAPKYYGLFNGGVNTAVTGMPTKQYREVQINLRPKEAAREAFTDSMLGMTGTINALVRDNLSEGSSADEQLEFMQDKCAQAAELLGLHKKARQVQPREYIAGNKRVMSVDLAARKRLALGQQQAEQPRLTECTA